MEETRQLTRGWVERERWGEQGGLPLIKHLQTESIDCLTLTGHYWAIPLGRTLSPLGQE